MTYQMEARYNYIVQEGQKNEQNEPSFGDIFSQTQFMFQARKETLLGFFWVEINYVARYKTMLCNSWDGDGARFGARLRPFLTLAPC